ncbi:hypothetical protein TNIN_8481 [Trichonephila inaurata madagascariensis]|uniref:Uncharacterized protein n=1 Tax=Trichonephila inaurata madagascariensis TaxID=2747483 RepID=A0A8X7C0Z5_9ARAC|nr:hypothetical protein TNIN_8481 [Trichonephila inaurata madagascariensis]
MPKSKWDLKLAKKKRRCGLLKHTTTRKGPLSLCWPNNQIVESHYPQRHTLNEIAWLETCNKGGPVNSSGFPALTDGLFLKAIAITIRINRKARESLVVPFDLSGDSCAEKGIRRFGSKLLGGTS